MATTDGTTPQAQTDTTPSAPDGGDSSQEVKITKADWERVNSLLGRVQDLQGGKDIAKQTRAEVAKLRDDVLPLLERAHSLGSQNKPLNEALTQIQGEQSEAEFRKAVMEIAQSMRGGAQPTGAGNAQGVDVAAVLAEYQLDPKDPYVAGKLAGQTFASKEQAELAAARILRDKTLAPQTNLSQQSSTPANAPTLQDQASLEAEMVALSKEPSKNWDRIQEIGKVLNAR
jgi:hypothetical protein